MKHTCHWPGCTKEVPPAMWGCSPHWFSLPKALRDRIWATYRRGQEITKSPSQEYLEAARAVQQWITAYQASQRGQGHKPMRAAPLPHNLRREPTMRGLTEDHDTHMNPGDEERIRKQAPTGQQAEPTDESQWTEVDLWAEIHRLRAAVKGPDGYASWQEAATAERIRRVKAERALAGQQSERPAPAGQAVGTYNGIPTQDLEHHAKRLHELLCAGDMIACKNGWAFNGWTADGRAVRHRIRIEGYERTGPTVEKERAALAASQAERAEGKPAAQEGGHG